MIWTDVWFLLMFKNVWRCYCVILTITISHLQINKIKHRYFLQTHLNVQTLIKFRQLHKCFVSQRIQYFGQIIVWKCCLLFTSFFNEIIMTFFWWKKHHETIWLFHRIIYSLDICMWFIPLIDFKLNLNHLIFILNVIPTHLVIIT